MKKSWFVTGMLVLIGTMVLVAVDRVLDIPKLDIDGDKVTVVGCEVERKGLAEGTCPKLFCSKTLLESEHAPTSAEIQYTSKKRMSLKAKELRAQYGRVKYVGADSNIVVKYFLCDMDGNEVAKLDAWDAREDWLAQLATLKREDQPSELNPGSPEPLQPPQTTSPSDTTPTKESE